MTQSRIEIGLHLCPSLAVVWNHLSQLSLPETEHGPSQVSCLVPRMFVLGSHHLWKDSIIKPHIFPSDFMTPVCALFSIMGMSQVFLFYFPFLFFPARCGNSSVGISVLFLSTDRPSCVPPLHSSQSYSWSSAPTSTPSLDLDLVRPHMPMFPRTKKRVAAVAIRSICYIIFGLLYSIISISSELNN